MYDPSLRNDLIELVSRNFKADEIDDLGRLLRKGFDSHALSGIESHITISARRCAAMLVEDCEERNAANELVKLLTELDGGLFQGRKITLEGLEQFLHHLATSGQIYDFERRNVVRLKKNIGELKNWGALRDGKTYDVTVMSLDIVGNSDLVKRFSTRKMEKVYYQLWEFLTEKLAAYDGRLWSWAGDGGICAFTFPGHAERAVRCAVELQSTIPLFNLRPSRPVDADIAIRLGLDTGPIRFFADTGKIVSEVINYAAHLEKRMSCPGCISISERVAAKLCDRIASVFEPAGVFEEAECFVSYRRMDDLLDRETCADDQPKANKNGRRRARTGRPGRRAAMTAESA